MIAMPRILVERAWPIVTTAAVVVASFATGCEQAPAEGSGYGGGRAVPTARVEVVQPERGVIRRSVGEPGQLQAFETAEIHARIAGYVKGWSVNIGASVQKGQLLAELAVPELEAEVGQKEAEIEQAVARRRQAEAAVEVAAADIAGAEAKLAEARAGIHRAEADVTRWRGARSDRTALRGAAQTGSLVDETRSKFRSADAALDEVRAQVKTAEVGMVQARAAP